MIGATSTSHGPMILPVLPVVIPPDQPPDDFRPSAPSPYVGEGVLANSDFLNGLGRPPPPSAPPPARSLKREAAKRR